MKVPRRVSTRRNGLPTGGIHVGVFGFSNPEWLLWPLGEFRVDRLVLLEMPDHDRARARLHEKGVDIDDEVGRLVKNYIVTEVDLWNPGAVARTLLDLSRQLKQPLWCNISTGPNPWCVAASLAAMFTDIEVFHVGQNGKDIVRVPAIRQPAPTKQELLLLAAMPQDGAEISGTLLKRNLRQTDFFRDSTSDKPAKNREQGQVNHHLLRLQEWGAITKGTHGARRTYRLGPFGSCIRTMFV